MQPHLLDLEAGDRTAVGLPRSVTLERWDNSWMSEFRVLMERTALETVRDRVYLVASLARSIAVYIFIGFCYFRLRRDQPSINDRVGVLFFWPANLISTTVTPVVLTFRLERTVRNRECASRVCISFLSWIPSHSTSCLAYASTPTPLCTSSPGSSASGLPPWSSLRRPRRRRPVRSQKAAQVTGPLSTVIFLLHGGGLTNFDDIAYPLAIFKCISPAA
ncbi:ATP-binding cassette sub- G member 2 [Cladochytrium tenue]|nr:ATP-binding cassette sub- G member 2 [Cladochytrium tenue]